MSIRLIQYSLGLVMLLALFPFSFASASAIDVSFEATPLFLDADVKPGDSTTRTVTITNTGAIAEDVYVSVLNTFSTGLDEVMELELKEGVVSIFSGTFEQFFNTTPLLLSQIPAGGTKAYDFTASLDSAVGNTYQETQLGFDLVIGWEGGSITDGPPTGGDGSDGNRTIGGRGSDRRTDSVLIIINEKVEGVDVPNGSAELTWNTNRRATTYLVCGDTATGSFALDPDALLFGYQFMVPEDTFLAVTHSATVSGLEPSTYECRPASREDTDDDFTVGNALRFTIPEPVVAGEAISASPYVDWGDIARRVAEAFAPRSGSVLGVGTGDKGALGAPTYDEWRAEMDAERSRRASSTEEADNQGFENVDTEAEQGSEDNNSDSGDDSPFPFSGTWWWFLLLALLAIMGGYWVAISRRS